MYSGRKILNIGLTLFFIVSVSSYIFRTNIGSFIWTIKCKSPVEWNQVRISFPKGMIYKVYDETKTIMFFHWEGPKKFLSVKKINLNKINKEYLIQFFKRKNYQVLEVEDIIFKGYQSFTISYIDKASNMYNKGIYIIPKNMCILYEGETMDYNDFNEVIDSIEFLE